MAIPLLIRRDRPGQRWGSPFHTSLLRAVAAVGLGPMLMLSLMGCEVGPDYQAPAVALTGFQNAAAVDARKAAQPPRLDDWWTGFNDPILTHIVQRALEQTLDLAAALARVQQARAAAHAAGAQLLPTIDLNAEGSALRQSLESPLGRIGSALPGYNRNQRLYDVGAAASWPGDLFRRLQPGVDAADAEEQAADAERLGTRISIAADAADAYFQVRGDQPRLAVTQRQIDGDAHLLDLVRQRHTSRRAPD